jgi:hypothetical protein
MADVNPVQLQRYLKGVDYPASRDDLVRRAREHGASDDVIEALERLPATRFESPSDVSQALGKVA